MQFPSESLRPLNSIAMATGCIATRCTFQRQEHQAGVLNFSTSIIPEAAQMVSPYLHERCFAPPCNLPWILGGFSSESSDLQRCVL